MRVNVYLLHVIAEIKAERKLRVRHYSSKLVKRLILAANPSLEELFVPVRGSRPKLVHITPLYVQEKGKVKTVKYVDEVANGRYHFFFGAVEEELDKYVAIDTFSAIPSSVKFGKTTYKIEYIEVREENLYKQVEVILAKLRESSKIKLVFASPTVFRDPLAGSKYKTLIPSIINIFSTPVYIKLFLSGKLRRRTLLRTLLRLHRALSVPPTFWQTLRKIDLQYEPTRNHRLPKLTLQP